VTTFFKVTAVLILVGIWVLIEALRDAGPRRPMGPP
jgi:hypothetical protein